MLRLLAIAALAVATLASFPSGAHAVPIGVRAKTRVALEHRRGPAGVVLVGRLLDDASLPVPDERITLELPGLAPVTRLTDRDGRFEVPLNTKEVNRLRRDGDLVTWTARFDGNSRLGDTAESGTLDLSKRSTRLRVDIGAHGPTVLGGPVEITVDLADVSEGTERPIAQAEVALEVGSGSELVGATGRSGAATFVVRPATFSGGGRYHVTARFGGDALHGPSRAETDLIVLLPTRITLRVVREGDAHQGRFRMSGRVSDQTGPLAGQVVALLAAGPSSDRSDGSGGSAGSAKNAFELVAATDADGVFVTALSAAELQAWRETLGGRKDRVRLDVHARYAPADDVHAPSESPSVALEIPPPPGVPIRWYLLGLGLVVSFIALAQALRSGSLLRALFAAQEWVRRLWDRLRGKRPIIAAEGSEPAFVTPFEAPAGSARRASDTISGVVIDAHTRAPLAANVSARHSSAGTERRLASAGPDGRFRLGPLEPGPWLVEVEAPGHLPREVALEVPHAGEYDGAYWALVAVHRSVRDIFAGALAGLGTDLAWGYATPREASRDALDEQEPVDRPVVAPPLGSLTDIVERTHFAPKLGTVADVERARALRQNLDLRRRPEGSK